MTGVANSYEVTTASSASMALDPTHVYYARVEAYQETKSGSVDIYWPIAEPCMLSGYSGAAGQWNKVSVVTKRNTFSAGSYQIRFDFNNANGTGVMWFDGGMLIDLTAEFGAGKEPDKAWCDANIVFGDDGKVSLLVGKIVLSQNFLQLNNLLIKDLTRRSISGGVDVSADIADNKPVAKTTFDAIYNNAVKDGYTGTAGSGVIDSLELDGIADKAVERGNQNIRA